MQAFLPLGKSHRVLESGAFACAYSPCGSVLACTTGTGAVSFQAPVEGKGLSPVKMLGTETGEACTFMENLVFVHAMHDAAQGAAAALSLEKGEYIRTFIYGGAEVYGLSSAHQMVIGSCATGETAIWDVRQRKAVGAIPGRGRPVCVYSPKGSIFALFFGELGEMKLFDPRAYTTGPYTTRRVPRERYTRAVFSPNESKIAVSFSKGGALLHGYSGKVIETFQTEETPSACFSSDGDQLLYLAAPDKVTVRHAQSLKELGELTLEPSQPSSDSPAMLYYNPGYRQLAVMADSSVTVWQ